MRDSSYFIHHTSYFSHLYLFWTLVKFMVSTQSSLHWVASNSHNFYNYFSFSYIYFYMDSLLTVRTFARGFLMISWLAKFYLIAASSRRVYGHSISPVLSCLRIFVLLLCLNTLLPIDEILVSCLLFWRECFINLVLIACKLLWKRLWPGLEITCLKKWLDLRSVCP